MTLVKLDRIDVRILEALLGNARITIQELAEKVALSPSACSSRVRKLETEGILLRYTSDINIEKVSLILEAFIEVTLENLSSRGMARFLQDVGDHPLMISCHRVTGHFDFLIHVVARDMPHLREISDHLLLGELGVSRINIIPILVAIKPFAGYPLKALLRDPDGEDSHA